MISRRTLLQAAALLPAAIGPRRAAAATAAPPAFFAYLQSAGAALIAFNPSAFDPRRPEPPSADSIKADLAALRPAFDGLVLYAFRAELTPTIIAEAERQGYRAVLFGIWDPRSAAELDGVAALIRRAGDRLACAVCIGNEGINDNRYQVADLDTAAAALRARLAGGPAVPFTTSEPAGDYGWAPLRAFGDFLAPNIHPAIDRRGQPPAAAAAWVHRRATVLAQFSGRPVLIKETGLPHGGGLGFTPDHQAAFWRALIEAGRRHPAGGAAGAFVSTAAAFEAFDAPWKAETLADPMEAAWGLLAVNRQPYPAFEVWRAVR
jgi:exo-beta-1,3-glucanase (GH17 family)